MKYLAIDYGQKRTGIAVSDTGGSMAFPRKTILMRTRAAFFEELLALIEAEATDAIVIGLPINLDGEESLTTRQVRNFSKSLARRTTLPLFWMEEALSSYEAERDLRDAGRSAAQGLGQYPTSRPPCCNPATLPRSTGSQTENHMNESPEETKNTPADPGAPRPEETGIPSGVSDTRNQQAPPDRQHFRCVIPRSSKNWAARLTRSPGEASPLDGEEPGNASARFRARDAQTQTALAALPARVHAAGPAGLRRSRSAGL